MRSNDVYDGRALLKNVALFVVALVLMRLTGGSGIVVLVPLMLFATMQGRTDKLFLYMMIMVAMLVGNGVLMPKNLVFSVTQKALMMILSIAMMLKLTGIRQSRLVTPFAGMFVYVAFMALSSLQGWNLIISSLKLLLFVSCFLAYYSMANTVISDRRNSIRGIRSAYLSLACFMLIGSVLLIPFPGLANMRSMDFASGGYSGANITSLFCGMTFHSQALGPLVATLFVLILGDLLFAVRKPQPLMIALLCCCPILIFKTSSRTAMGTMLASASFLMWQFMQARHMNSRWRGKVVSTALILMVIACVALLCTGGGRRSVVKYLAKGGFEEGMTGVSVNDVVSSRQGLMDFGLENFRKKPLIGNGFQVSEALVDAEKGGIRAVLSAPVEKGVWVTAILEEGGILGFLIFVSFAVTALVLLKKRGAYVTASVFLSIVILNLGEFTMFSMSGIGGCYWCLCFAGAVMDAQRLLQMKLMAVRPIGPAVPPPPGLCPFGKGFD